jgi:hypothetical protein
MKNASRDSPQFSFGDLISFNNHLSFPSCSPSYHGKDNVAVVLRRSEISEGISVAARLCNMYLFVRFARARQRITASAPISLALSRNARNATTCVEQGYKDESDNRRVSPAGTAVTFIEVWRNTCLSLSLLLERVSESKRLRQAREILRGLLISRFLELSTSARAGQDPGRDVKQGKGWKSGGISARIQREPKSKKYGGERKRTQEAVVKFNDAISRLAAQPFANAVKSNTAVDRLETLRDRTL